MERSGERWSVVVRQIVRHRQRSSMFCTGSVKVAMLHTLAHPLCTLHPRSRLPLSVTVAGFFHLHKTRRYAQKDQITNNNRNEPEMPLFVRVRAAHTQRRAREGQM